MEQAREIGNWMTQNQAAIETVTELNLSSLNLRTVPPEIRLFRNLERLNLAGNQLTTPLDVSANRQLTNLDLSRNQLTTTPDVRANPPTDDP